MTAYNFQSQFVEAIRSGAKRQTIRKEGKRMPAHPGETLQLYTGMRTRHCQKIADAVCVDCWPIRIFPNLARVELLEDGCWQAMTSERLEAFIQADGFLSRADFFAFFKRYGSEQFSGDLITWRLS